MILNNESQFVLPNDIIQKMMKIYKHMGARKYYDQLSLGDKQKIMELIVQRDSYFIFSMLDMNVSEQRIRLIITKNSLPRTNQEEILYNLKGLLHNYLFNFESISDSPQALNNLVNYLFKNENVHFRYQKKGEEKTVVSLENDLETLYSKYKDMEKNHEMLTLLFHYFLDFRFLSPFTDRNDIISLLIVYYNLVRLNVDCLNYVSFFEILYQKKQEFINSINKANVNWAEGISQTSDFLRFMFDLLLEMYEKRDQEMIKYESQLNENKGDSIEETILSFDKLFSKSDIRRHHPYVSESTINRVISKLSEDGKIVSTGKGRSAKWEIKKH